MKEKTQVTDFGSHILLGISFQFLTIEEKKHLLNLKSSNTTTWYSSISNCLLLTIFIFFFLCNTYFSVSKRCSCINLDKAN